MWTFGKGICITILLFFLPSLLYSKSGGHWIEYDKNNNPLTIEWYSYNNPDEEIISKYLLVIPIYARAKAPFRIEQIQAFRKLPIEEQQQFPQYLHYPHDLNINSALPYIEESLMLDLLTELETEEHLSRSNQNYLVIAKDQAGDILGFTHFCYHEGDFSAELEPLMIDPQAQGRGIARKLIFSILKLEPAILRIYLCTDAMNFKSQSIYRHLGFHELFRTREISASWDYETSVFFEWKPNS